MSGHSSPSTRSRRRPSPSGGRAGAIMHLKTVVIDGTIVVRGSTNWSAGGETLQDNELTVEASASSAAVATARIGAIHANMLNRSAPPITPADDLP